MKKFAVLLAFSFLIMPTASLATEGPSIVPNTLQEGPAKLVCLIRDVTNWIFTGFLVVAVIFILLAAYYYLIAEGGAEEVLKTHRMLIYSAVGIAVAILSRGFVTIVQSVTGVPIQEACATGGPQQGSLGQQGGTSTGGGTGGSGGGSGSSGSGSTGGGASASQWSNLPFQIADGSRPFDAQVLKCTDGETPGVVISYGEGQKWSNFDPVSGNPNIPSATHESAQAGLLGIVGNIHTGFANLGSRYDFSVETCNNGDVSIVMVDEEQDGTFDRVTP